MMIACVIHAVIFVGIAYMIKMENQLSAKRMREILMVVLAIAICLDVDCMNISRRTVLYKKEKVL